MEIAYDREALIKGRDGLMDCRDDILKYAELQKNSVEEFGKLEVAAEVKEAIKAVANNTQSVYLEQTKNNLDLAIKQITAIIEGTKEGFSK